MKTFRSIVVVSLLLLPPLSTAAEDTSLCSCKFDGTDASDCRVYGQLGDDVLIPWYLAPQQCLDAHNIKISAIPPSTLDGMCQPPNANAFTNYLKFDSGSSAATSIKQSYTQFWDGDASPVTLAPSINGVDCEADASGCWTEIKSYFSSNPEEIEDNCQTFYNAARKDLELEQSTVRISICNNEITVADDECGDLQTQVEEMKGANPEKACSAFGLGPVTGGSEEPPACGGEDEGGVAVLGVDNSDGESTSSVVATKSLRGLSLGLIMIVMNVSG